MKTADEYVDLAEKAMTQSNNAWGRDVIASKIARAQVWATLALVSALQQEEFVVQVALEEDEEDDY